MTYGFIGTGNMASSLIRVLNQSIQSKNIYISNRTISRAKNISKELNVNLSTNLEIAEKCDYIILGVKPQMMKDVINEIKEVLKERKNYILVSMAAGYTISNYFEYLGFECPFIRIMPNTPVSVNEGVIIYTSKNTKQKDVERFVKEFSKAGKLINIDEDHFDQAGTISGCGPAYMDMIIEAISDAGVYCGLTRKQSIELASQMMLGSAKLILETGKNPIVLKDEVTSPGGTTIEGVQVLEKHKINYAFQEAIIAAYKKNEVLRKKK